MTLSKKKKKKEGWGGKGKRSTEEVSCGQAALQSRSCARHGLGST